MVELTNPKRESTEDSDIFIGTLIGLSEFWNVETKYMNGWLVI